MIAAAEPCEIGEQIHAPCDELAHYICDIRRDYGGDNVMILCSDHTLSLSETAIELGWSVKMERIYVP